MPTQTCVISTKKKKRPKDKNTHEMNGFDVSVHLHLALTKPVFTVATATPVKSGVLIMKALIRFKMVGGAGALFVLKNRNGLPLLLPPPNNPPPPIHGARTARPTASLLLDFITAPNRGLGPSLGKVVISL